MSLLPSMHQFDLLNVLLFLLLFSVLFHVKGQPQWPPASFTCDVHPTSSVLTSSSDSVHPSLPSRPGVPLFFSSTSPIHPSIHPSHPWLSPPLKTALCLSEFIDTTVCLDSMFFRGRWKVSHFTDIIFLRSSLFIIFIYGAALRPSPSVHPRWLHPSWRIW